MKCHIDHQNVMRLGPLEGSKEARLVPLPVLDADEGSPSDVDEPSDLEELDMPSLDDRDWEVFIIDDDQRDPFPEPGDFWVERDSPDRPAA